MASNLFNLNGPVPQNGSHNRCQDQFSQDKEKWLELTGWFLPKKAWATEGATEYEAHELYQTHLLVASAPDDLQEHSDDATSDLSIDSCNSEQAMIVGKKPSEV